MPKLTDHPSQHAIKLLVASDSGTGKTGGLASLVDAGYTIRALDFDNGISTLRGFIRDKALMSNVSYLPLFDTFKLAGKTVGVAKADAFQSAMTALQKGTDAWGDDPGPLEAWPADDVLVIDTFSTMGRAALAMVMQLDGKGMGHPEIQHYGVAMDNLEKFVGIITSDAIRCNVILNTHMMNVEGTTKIYPEALGAKLGPKIGRYFDNMITIGRSGGRLQYKTKSDGSFNCKTSIPLADTYPLESGLRDIFAALKKG